MTFFGKQFSREDLEMEIGESISDIQWNAMKFELEDAFSFYFDRDLADWESDIREGTPSDVEEVDTTQFEIEEANPEAGSFLFDKEKVEQKLGFEISKKDFSLIVDFFSRAFAKYFREECERLWGDIDSIVEDFLESQ